MLEGIGSLFPIVSGGNFKFTLAKNCRRLNPKLSPSLYHERIPSSTFSERLEKNTPRLPLLKLRNFDTSR